MNKLMLSLIRHGKTEANEKHLYCGKSDINLSENGINELNDIKSSIKYPECNNFFSSGAKRANVFWVIGAVGSGSSVVPC